MSIQLYGRQIDVLNTACPLDPPEVVRAVTRGKGSKVPRSTEGYKRDPRSSWISGLVTHTTSGTVRSLDPKPLIESVRDWAYAKYDVQQDDKSWSTTVDLDGSAIQVCDPAERATWHAGRVNAYTDGWELVQTSAGTLTSVQLDAYVRLVDEFTWHAGVPRIIPWRDGRPYLGMLTRALAAHGGGRTLCCIYAHRNVWTISKVTGKLVPVRGEGDPSRLPFDALKAAGYLALDVEAGEDLALFKGLQAEHGLTPDGVWGPQSRLALARRGDGGMLVKRPGDELRGVPAWITARGIAL